MNAGDVSLDTTLPRLPTAAPQQSSGELTSADLPLASALGPGWAVRVEGADVDGEDGVGNGTAFQERDPDEVVETTIPMGCEVRSASPVPGNVLQATYTHRQSGAYAVILRMRFATADDARAFARVRETDLQACVDQPDDPYSGDPAPVRSVEARAGQTASTYTQVGERQTWYSLARVEGRDVVTLDADPPNPVLVTWQAVGYEAP